MARKIHPSDKCLNCDEALRGKYCSTCGQDNLDHQETMWHLLQHFLGDITHYDSHFWTTLKPLLTKPGFLTHEYVKGRRASYLNPVRMFIFLNFIFFLLLAWFSEINVAAPKKSLTSFSVSPHLNKKSIVQFSQPDTESILKNGDLISITTGTDSSGKSEITTVHEYDSAQNELPVAERDGRLKRKSNEVLFSTIQKFKSNHQSFEDNFRELFLHNTAKLTFIFIIVCSLLLYLLYYRRGMLMINHALFTIHLSCTFLLLFICMLLASFVPRAGGYLEFALLLYGGYYFYKALRTVYGQSFLKTSLKFLIINFILFIVMAAALVINVLITLVSISNN